MVTWQIFLRNERIANNLKYEQEATKRKIGAFLDAASTGKLWNNEQQTPTETATSTNRQPPKPRRVSIAARTPTLSTRPRSAAAPLNRTSSTTRPQSETRLDDFFQISSPRHAEEDPTQRA